MCASTPKLHKHPEAEGLIRQPDVGAQVKITLTTMIPFSVDKPDARRFREAEFPGFSKTRIINQVIYNMMRFEQSDTSVFCQGIVSIADLPRANTPSTLPRQTREASSSLTSSAKQYQDTLRNSQTAKPHGFNHGVFS